MKRSLDYMADINMMRLANKMMVKNDKKNYLNPTPCIGFDLDGTLLDNGEWKSGFISLINQLEGYKVFFATGRSILECERLLLNVRKDILVICDEGQYIFDNEKGYTENIFLPLGEDEYCFFAENGIEVAVETKDYIYTESNVIEKLLKLYCGVPKSVVLRRNPRECRQVYKIYYYEKKEGFVRSIEKKYNITEIVKRFGYLTDCNVNKYKAFKKLQRSRNLRIEDSIYFGDGLNDVEIMKKVKTGIAVYNAVPKLKDVSTIIMDSDEEFIHILSSLKDFGEPVLFKTQL